MSTSPADGTFTPVGVGVGMLLLLVMSIVVVILVVLAAVKRRAAHNQKRKRKLRGNLHYNNNCVGEARNGGEKVLCNV